MEAADRTIAAEREAFIARNGAMDHFRAAEKRDHYTGRKTVYVTFAKDQAFDCFAVDAATGWILTDDPHQFDD